jgi:hypothetical protein
MSQEYNMMKEKMESLQAKNREFQGALYIEKQSNASLQGIIEGLRQEIEQLKG